MKINLYSRQTSGRWLHMVTRGQSGLRCVKLTIPPMRQAACVSKLKPEVWENAIPLLHVQFGPSMIETFVTLPLGNEVDKLIERVTSVRKHMMESEMPRRKSVLKRLEDASLQSVRRVGMARSYQSKCLFPTGKGVTAKDSRPDAILRQPPDPRPDKSITFCNFSSDSGGMSVTASGGIISNRMGTPPDGFDQ